MASPKAPAALALVALLASDAPARAGGGAIVTRIRCHAEAATDTPRAPRERVADYRRYQESFFAGNREIRCFPGGDYALPPLVDQAGLRLSAALDSLAPGVQAPPTRWYGAWQRAPDPAVPPGDVTRAWLTLDGCTAPSTDPRPVCRARLRVWYFHPGMWRERLLLDLVVHATRSDGFDPARFPFQDTLDPAAFDAAPPPPIDLIDLFTGSPATR